VPAFGAIKGFVLDTPTLRDQDEPSGRSYAPYYYFQGGFSDDAFRRGKLFFSLDNVDFVGVGDSVGAGMTWGVVNIPPEDPPFNNPHATDYTSSINVIMNTGGDSMVSVTNLQMLNNSNMAVIIRDDGLLEIINFQDVTTESDGSFTLTTLLRGRRGTDTMTNDHKTGSTFILLDGLNGGITAVALANLAVRLHYRSVGVDQIFEDGERIAIDAQHRSLMPYAPVHLEAAINVDDVDLIWERRTRYGGPLLPLFGKVPFNEDDELYEIDILDGPGTKATGTLTLTGNLSADDEIQIGGRIYTIVLAVGTADGNILLGATDEDTVRSIIAAINGGIGRGVIYAEATEVHRDVFATVGSTAKKVDLEANTPGVSENTLVTTEDGGAMSFAATTLGGGVDAEVKRTLGVSPLIETNAVTYLEADLDLDWGTGIIPPTLTIRVYQISGQVGRGFTFDQTVDVL
jgi:hypothetical protein